MGQLTAAEKRNLKQHEETIEQGQQAFMADGRALLAIREEQLYLEKYDSFGQYVTKKWGFSKRWANQQIASMEAADDVSELEIELYDGKNGIQVGTVVPTLNERQARELAKLESPASRADAISKAAAEAPIVDGKPKITASAIKRVIKESTGVQSLPKTTKPPATVEITASEWCGHQAKQIAQIRVDIDKWKKKHAKGDSLWQECLDQLDVVHIAFKKLGKKPS